MDFNNFLRPTKGKILLFILIFGLIGLYISTMEVIPCEFTSVRPLAPAGELAVSSSEGECFFGEFIGFIGITGRGRVFDNESRLIGFSIIVIWLLVSYLLASLIMFFIVHKRAQKLS